METDQLPLLVLIVDDDAVTRALLRRFIEDLGHRPVEAQSGDDALAYLQRQTPDIVLIDCLMPGLDGVTTAREIKRRLGERWVPIIFLTVVEDESELIAALSVGGDDYLTKPINYRILRAKIVAFARSVRLHQRVREQTATLQRYRDRMVEEQRIATHLMARLVNSQKLSDPWLRYWLSPAEFLSGDLLAAARTPNGALYLMLADGVGHGLTAALGVLPVTQPFYAMAEKGLSIRAIAREINGKIRQLLPLDRFVAAVIVAVHAAERLIEIWNGGIPALTLFNREGGIEQQWRSTHLPLGLLEDGAFEEETVSYPITQPFRLLLCSDGLLEAEAPDGSAFGFSRLFNIIPNAVEGDVVASVRRAVTAHLAGRPQHDDISLAIVHYDDSAGLQA